MTRLFIVIVPRSGSSMITSIFGAHGFYLGDRGGIVNPGGYRHYENYEIRRAINARVKLDADSAFKHFIGGSTQRDIRKIFDSKMPKGRNWAYKVGVDHWPIIDGIYDPMTCVIVRRDLEATIASQMDKRVGIAANASLCREINTRRTEFMDQLAAEKGFPVVQAEEVVRGDFSSLQTAFDYIDHPFDPQLAKKRINPELWRH